jgi:hypothetical protein
MTGAYVSLRHRDLAMTAAAAAAGSAAYAIVYAVNVRRASATVTARMLQTSPDAVDVSFAAATGIGIWTVIAGAVALAAASVALMIRSPSAASVGRSHGRDS